MNSILKQLLTDRGARNAATVASLGIIALPWT